MAKLDGKFIGEIRRATTGELIPDDRWVAFMAYDNAFVGTLKYYRNKCQQLGCSQEQLSAVDALILRVDQWREANPELCRKPEGVKLSGTSMMAPAEMDDDAIFTALEMQNTLHQFLRDAFYRELTAMNPTVSHVVNPHANGQPVPEADRIKFEKLFDVDDARSHHFPPGKGFKTLLEAAMREFAIEANNKLLSLPPGVWPSLLYPVIRREAFMIELQWVCILYQGQPAVKDTSADPPGQVVSVMPLPSPETLDKLTERLSDPNPAIVDDEEPLAAERKEE